MILIKLNRIYIKLIITIHTSSNFDTSFSRSICEMKEITVWDILLLLEFIVYFVFMLLVALEFCSTSFSVYFFII